MGRTTWIQKLNPHIHEQVTDTCIFLHLQNSIFINYLIKMFTKKKKNLFLRHFWAFFLQHYLCFCYHCSTGLTDIWTSEDTYESDFTSTQENSNLCKTPARGYLWSSNTTVASNATEVYFIYLYLCQINAKYQLNGKALCQRNFCTFKYVEFVKKYVFVLPCDFHHVNNSQSLPPSYYVRKGK